jgi:alkylation response protein AidB-like acyl-CoA dehydrogenase
LVEGYGLAEAGPVVALSNPRIVRPGAVGPPLAGVDVRIDDRPGSCGQLLVHTRCRALAVCDAEGSRPVPEWLETGDLATVDADGQLRITGRIADAIVLSTGIKVPPAEIEAALAEDECLAQVCVIGSGCPWPVALVVPEPTVIRAAIRRLGVRVAGRQAALRHPRVLAWLARRLARRQGHLPHPWQVRRAVLVGRPFTAARGEATESLKLKRSAIAHNFRHVIHAVSAERTGRPRPAWMVGIPCPESLKNDGPGDALPRRWLAASVWHGAAEDGFAAAAAPAILPLRDAVAAVLERSEETIDRLRRAAALYEPLADVDRRQPPLADAPDPPRGLFSSDAEAALGDAGLWGLAVPEAFGGTGCSMQELAAAITRLAANVPTAAGMLSIHSSIGAVSALVAFGTPEQQAYHLPALAAGRPLSIFGGTEPDAGCDLGAAAARIERVDGKLLLTGTKMFITGATHGRLVKVLAKEHGRPTVVLVRLPAADTATCRLVGYPLHPLRHAHNQAIVFTGHEIDPRDILTPPSGKQPDAMKIVWHGLNRGRVTLAAQAAGTLRILHGHAARYAAARRTWGAPIAERELVQGRLGRLAAATLACDALAAWAAAAIDSGQTGELEAICAKVIAGECVRDGAIDALGIHGGRAFLVGHPLGDAWHDHFAVTVYEGESDLLGLALFKGLCKHHPLVGVTGRRAAAWLAWRLASVARPSGRDGDEIIDAGLRAHARQARRLLGKLAVGIDRALRTHGRGLADRQLLAGGLAEEARCLVSVLAVAHRGDMLGDEASLAAADGWCRLALARATGRRLTADDQTRIAALGRLASG